MEDLIYFIFFSIITNLQFIILLKVSSESVDSSEQGIILKPPLPAEK